MIISESFIESIGSAINTGITDLLGDIGGASTTGPDLSQLQGYYDSNGVYVVPPITATRPVSSPLAISYQTIDTSTYAPQSVEPTIISGPASMPSAAPANGMGPTPNSPPSTAGRNGQGTPQSNQSKYGKCLSNVQNFINTHGGDASTLANQLGNGTTPAEVLATSGNETGWGGGFASIGNYFGLHGNGPAGTYYTTSNHTPVQMFSGPDTFMSSGEVFVGNISPYLSPGMGQNPLGFFSILNQHGYATGNSGYPAGMVQNDGSTRGPYTLVMACMAGG